MTRHIVKPLVRLPTPLRRILSMVITNSCATGRKMPRTKNQSKYIHGNSPGYSSKDRPRDIRNLGKLILPIMKLLYFGLSIASFVSNIRVPTQVLNQTTTILLISIVTNN